MLNGDGSLIGVLPRSPSSLKVCSARSCPWLSLRRTLAWTGELPRKWARDVSLAFVAFFLVGAPWFVIAGLRQGQAFVETFLLGGSLGVGRFFHPALSAPGATPGWIGLLAYVVFLPLGVLPWTGWLWPGLRQGWRIRSARPWVLRVCAIWVVTILAFLTISPGDK